MPVVAPAGPPSGLAALVAALGGPPALAGMAPPSSSSIHEEHGGAPQGWHGRRAKNNQLWPNAPGVEAHEPACRALQSLVPRILQLVEERSQEKEGDPDTVGGHLRAVVLKERRKAREERSLRKSKKGKGEGKKEGDPPE